MKPYRYKICIAAVLVSLLCLMTGITQSLHIQVCHHEKVHPEHGTPCLPDTHDSGDSNCRICQVLAGDQNSYQPDISPALVFGFDAGYYCLCGQQTIVLSFAPSPKASRAPPVL
ncbi:MAG: hypothetical protein ABFD91_11710 [Anaerohalosphaeraceae bacterium]